MSTIGVAGAGVMGSGVAQNLAQSGHQVILCDVREEVLERALATIERSCRMSRLLGGPAVDADAVRSAIRTSVGVEPLRDADIVIENITEDWDAKATLYRELDAVCPEHTVFVVNTSAIPITRVGSVTGRPDRVVGVHFMNPVPMKPAVELIGGHHTSDETLRRTRELLASIDKKPLDVHDSPGFVSNRVLMLTVNEAAFLVHEGVADAETVDAVFRDCFGHPMGPLETADLIGVDTILQSVEVLHAEFADSKYRPCPLLRRMTEAGLTGRKAGAGFHRYEGAAAPLAAVV